MAAIRLSLYPPTHPIISGRNESTSPAQMECFKTLTDHSKSVTSVVALPNGKFASGSFDTKILIWNHDGECTDTFWNDYFNVRALAPITDIFLGSGLAGTSNGQNKGTVQRWDIKEKTSKSLGDYNCDILALAVSQDKRLASGDYQGFLNIVNPFSQKLELGPIATASPIRSLAFVENGRTIATGQSDGTILLWDSHNGNFLKSFKMHKDGVTALTVLPDGTLVSGSTDGNIILWDPSKAPSQAWIKTLKSGPIASLTTQSDFLISGSWDKSFTVWNPSTAAFWQSPFTEHQGPIFAVAAFEDMIVTGSEDKTLKLWRPLKARL